MPYFHLFVSEESEIFYFSNGERKWPFLARIYCLRVCFLILPLAFMLIWHSLLKLVHAGMILLKLAGVFPGLLPVLCIKSRAGSRIAPYTLIPVM